MKSKIPSCDIRQSLLLGLTAAEIARRHSTTVGAVRSKARRMQSWVAKEAELSTRQIVAKMPVNDALEYVLNTLEQLEESLVASEAKDFGLPKYPSRLFSALKSEAGKCVSTSSLFTRIYYDRLPQDYPEEKIIAVMISKMRKRLPPEYEIETVWGYGYRLTERKADDTPSRID